MYDKSIIKKTIIKFIKKTDLIQPKNGCFINLSFNGFNNLCKTNAIIDMGIRYFKKSITPNKI